MDALIPLIGLLSLVCVIVFVIISIKKRGKKPIAPLLVSIAVFVVCLVITPSPKTAGDTGDQSSPSPSSTTSANTASPTPSETVVVSPSVPPSASALVPSSQPALAESRTIPENSSFEVHFIDVGQADSALVLCDGKAMLIDGGNVADSDLVYTYLKNHDVSQLDYVVNTHAHEDHVGGLAGALNYASVSTALVPVTTYDSKAFSNFVKYLDSTEITIPKPGDRYTLGSASFEIYGPINSSTEPNNTSIVLKLTYGDTSFMFTGDAERDEEQDILDAGYDLSATVLKVGHHGSDTSTTYPFLREIMPQYAVISAGQGNSYGHPTENTLSRLRDADVKTFRTDMQGTVVCTSDGKAVSFTTERNSDIDTLDLSTADGHYGQPTAPSKDSGNSSPVPASTPSPEPTQVTPTGTDYILNTNTYKFHYPYCSSVNQMNESNKNYYTGNRNDVIAMGYVACKRCDP